MLKDIVKFVLVIVLLVKVLLVTVLLVQLIENKNQNIIVHV